MLDSGRIAHYGRLLREEEAERPLLSLWRIQMPGGKRQNAKERAIQTICRVKGHLYSLRRSQQPAPGQLVFYASANTPATLGAIAPLIRMLLENGDSPFFISNPSTQKAMGDLLRDEIADYRVWLARLSYQIRKSARGEALSLARILREPFGEEYDETISQSLEIATLAERAGAIFLQGAGALIMETDYFPVAKGLALGARRVGVPVITVQHGLFGPHQFPMHTEALLCYGDYFRKSAIMYGMRGDIPRVTGCPRWDIIESYRSLERNPSLRAVMGGKRGCPLPLLISDAQGKHFYKGAYPPFFRGVRRLLESGLPVAIRLHPSERGLENYSGEIPEHLLKKLTVLPKEMSLDDAIRHSDVVYNVFSTAAIEALLLDVPVLFSEPESGPKLTDIPDSGGGMWCTEDQVVDLCTRLARDGEARGKLLRSQSRFLAEAVANRGTATERSLDAINEVVAERYGRRTNA